MRIEGVVRFVNWEFRKCLRLMIELKTIFWMPRKKIDLDKLLADYNNDNFFFIQVGANDGLTGDNLRAFIEKYNWQGILVEPVPYVFERLKVNYSGFSKLSFENSAISSETGFSKFYSMAERDLDNSNLFENYQDYKIDQLSSFDKETLMKHSYMHPSFVKLIHEIDIPTLSMSDLLSKYKVKKIDLLQVDTEGYDFEILNTFDFKKISPTIIIYEHQHMKLIDYKTLVKKFRKNGYKSFKCNWDTVSIKE